MNEIHITFKRRKACFGESCPATLPVYLLLAYFLPKSMLDGLERRCLYSYGALLKKKTKDMEFMEDINSFAK